MCRLMKNKNNSQRSTSTPSSISKVTVVPRWKNWLKNESFTNSIKLPYHYRLPLKCRNQLAKKSLRQNPVHQSGWLRWEILPLLQSKFKWKYSNHTYQIERESWRTWNRGVQRVIRWVFCLRVVIKKRLIRFNLKMMWIVVRRGFISRQDHFRRR